MTNAPSGRPDWPRDRAGYPAFLYSTLRFISRHARGFFGAIISFLSLGFIVALIFTGIFVLFSRIVAHGWTQAADEAALRWFGQHRMPWLDKIMLEITILGSGSVLSILVLTASVFLWLTQHRWSVYILIAGVLGGQIGNAVLKDYFERPRPTIVTHADQVASLSFPSGHAMTSMVVYGSIAYLVSRLEPTRRLRNVTLAIVALLILLIGISRIYLGVHYPSDVLGGYLAGLAWIAYVVSSHIALRYFARRRPHTHVEEQDLNATPPDDSGTSMSA